MISYFLLILHDWYIVHLLCCLNFAGTNTNTPSRMTPPMSTDSPVLHDDQQGAAQDKVRYQQRNKISCLILDTILCFVLSVMTMGSKL